MTEKDKLLLIELEQKKQLYDKEFTQYEVLKRMQEAESRVGQFHRNQQLPYEDKISRAGNLAWEFYKKLDGKCNTRQHCLKCWIDWLKQPTED